MTDAMNIDDIEPTLFDCLDAALEELGAPQGVTAELAFEEPPSAEMGDLGLPCFPLAPHLEWSPAAIADELADRLADELDRRGDRLADSVENQGPYVNISFDDGALATLVVSQALDERPFGADRVEDCRRWVVEFSAPNTNKPQHVGHVRNDLLGETVSTIAEFAGHDVTRVNLINDRGIHICKSMVAYQLDDDPQTPEDTGKKGDHLVGDYYVEFNDKLQQEYDSWLETEEAEKEFDEWIGSPESRHAVEEETDGLSDAQLKQVKEDTELDDPLRTDLIRTAFKVDFRDQYFNEYSELGARAKEMLRRWEEGNEEVRRLWKEMNDWVLDGFEETYDRLGVDFDQIDWESETYEEGREVVERGLEEGLFEQKDDGAVVFDLNRIGMDGEKVVLRSDGTSVYITQDLGTALRRRNQLDFDRMTYVVGDEQDYHFDVLFGILSELDPDLEGRLHHLSYGMVDLPSGRMKSREGEVVDADDLMDEMHDLAAQAVRERHGELADEEIDRRAEIIGMAALKFHILDYNPRTRVQFDPEKSIA
ncbi:MAG: arginine--tRNA ligase, partial [Bradymonadaceae bacterium]